MGSWSTIRTATNEDMDRLNAAAARFIARHGLTSAVGHYDEDEGAWYALDLELDYQAGNDMPGETVGHYRRALWRAAKRRALRESAADGVAYGYIGYNVN